MIRCGGIVQTKLKAWATRPDVSKTNDGWKIIPLILLLLVATPLGQYIYNSYKENQTATVQEVHDGGRDATGSYFKLYMNDGTVWLVHSDFSVIAGDKIRYKHEGDISKPGLDALDFCHLANVTRGAEMAAERIDGPTKDTSCPANGSNEEQAQTRTEHAPTELPQIEPALTEPVEECAVRFWNKLIHEIDGKSVVDVCKENPNRQPTQ